jgi:O-antigen/teichoic acid export membrane protein
VSTQLHPKKTQTTVSGMRSIALASVLARLAGLGGQLALGWFLAPRDFGVYALAVGISGVVTALRNGGTTQVLVTRPDSYAKNVGLYFRFSLAFNLFAAALLMVAATATYSRKPDLALILVGIGLSFPIGTHAALLRGNLTIHKKFRELSVIDVASAVTWQISVCSLAWLGFGAMSFAVPPVLQAIVETALAWVYATKVPRITKYGRQAYLRLFRDTRWIVLSAFLLAFSTTGDYFAVGVLANLRTTGAYFFAFQLAVSLTGPINASIETALPTLLAAAAGEPARQRAIYRTVTNFVLLLVVPASVGFALIARPIVELAWQGKWDYAIPAIQLLVVCTPAWLLVSIGRALLDAQGLWRLRFLVIGIYGVGGISAAAVGALTNELSVIALLVTAFYVAFAAVLLFVVGRLVGWPPRAGAVNMAPTLAINIVALFTAEWIASYAPIQALSVRAVTVLLYIPFVVLANYCFLREDFRNLWNSLLRRHVVVETNKPSQG